MAKLTQNLTLLPCHFFISTLIFKSGHIGSWQKLPSRKIFGESPLKVRMRIVIHVAIWKCYNLCYTSHTNSRRALTLWLYYIITCHKSYIIWSTLLGLITLAKLHRSKDDTETNFLKTTQNISTETTICRVESYVKVKIFTN